MACEGCVQELQRRQPSDSHTGYVRGLLFGGGAAIVGMAGYAGFTILTGLYIGYVSLAVGWLVGKAIMLRVQGHRRKTIPDCGGDPDSRGSFVGGNSHFDLVSIEGEIPLRISPATTANNLPLTKRIANLTRHSQSRNLALGPPFCSCL